MHELDLTQLDFPVPYEKIFYEGKFSEKRKVAVVGTRVASVEYCNFARKLGRELALHGVNVVSGFAFGIDIYAHLGCLDSCADESVTVILATPLTKIYPKDHQKYVQKILSKNGFIGSVLANNQEPTKHDFVKRNAVMAAISEIVVFVQGSVKSGAMHTVKFALEYGKEVFVVPGPPWDENCSGTNSLLKEGCPVLTSVDDLLDALAISKRDSEPQDMSPQERAVLATIKSSKDCFIEDLVVKTNLTPFEIEQALFALEQKGLIEILFTDQILLRV